MTFLNRSNSLTLTSSWLVSVFMGFFAVYAEEDGGRTQWQTSEGQQVLGVPLKSAYNKESRGFDFVFKQADGNTFTVPCSAFTEECGDEIRKEIATRSTKEKLRIAEQQAAIERQQREQERQQREQQAAAERQQKEEQLRLEEQRNAEMLVREFTLVAGGTVTGAKINDHNDEIKKDMAVFVVQADAADLVRINSATENFLPIKRALMRGDRDSLRNWMKKILKAGPGVSRDIAWLVGQTPMGGAVIPCADGQALHWREAWEEACGSLVP